MPRKKNKRKAIQLAKAKAESRPQTIRYIRPPSVVDFSEYHSWLAVAVAAAFHMKGKRR